MGTLRDYLDSYGRNNPDWAARSKALAEAFFNEPTPAPSPMVSAYGIEGCGCYECVDRVISVRPFPDNLMYPFIVCATCGNKRCPKAQSHANECTGSNEPGQPGSTRYPAR